MLFLAILVLGAVLPLKEEGVIPRRSSASCRVSGPVPSSDPNRARPPSGPPPWLRLSRRVDVRAEHSRQLWKRHDRTRKYSHGRKLRNAEDKTVPVLLHGTICVVLGCDEVRTGRGV